MRTSDFDFELPEELIALEPPAERTDARMLHVGDGIVDRSVKDLVEVLRAGDLLVLNDTKVIPAALEGRRLPREDHDGGPAGQATPAEAPRAVSQNQGVVVEANLIEHLEPREGRAHWRSFARPGKRLKVGDRLDFRGLTAEVVARNGMETDILFDVAEGDFDGALMKAGMPPLPPYIARKRGVREDDRERYQTVYAREAGSVAAPTAGLHFTDELFAQLEAKGVGRAYVTLHVGAGTFLPVSTDDVSDHKMHSEWGVVSEETAAAIAETRAQGGRIIAVGTTSLRLLESAWNGEKVAPFRGDTDIFLKPGDKFPSTDLLMTNFHLPKSTLFMLVCGYAGTEEMKAAYAHAVAEKYRFFSYGDACLLEKKA
ncbi:tRNA preQ1(34) S-adenosylmethionine ribosyltransferase-isomerase QueA [Parvularcula lutaonensis]|uniref:S-adenosylmethionine:tRNA ribosyltransferase-isomerase n=1 Tax=Parvularcula lutaonensis TaxID=491923 RepID=A0ABV7M7F1_9PROT|nr:tRNA preQ1(34) S-adenosylmethionine ribosyltransferase-isomerase QueA [Parvularcula lutaonensis]GGY42032.1 S-adenosylmethionine:tRNA ribosyltransferase-isomerase [Parvularcula lutaonensis]